MLKGIIGWTATKENEGIKLTRATTSGYRESLTAKDFETAATFLADDRGEALHVCWSLHAFRQSLFTLLPAKTLDELNEGKPKVYCNNVKIFSVDHLLGITIAKLVSGNIWQRLETNLYQLMHWLPDGIPEPDNATEVAKLGEQVIDGLESMGIYPDRLTSPVALYEQTYLNGYFPTIYSFNENWLEAMQYASQMMRYEWRSAYKLGYFDKAWAYDLMSAYPAIILNLPSTDGCYAQYSTTYQKHDWGILKGKVEVTAPISPLVYDIGEGYINPSGTWQGYFTTEEIAWLEKWQAGKFTLEDGWFFKFGSNKPYKQVIGKLLTARANGSGMVANLAKKVAQGLSGKLDQDNQDGSWGNLFNPILAAMTRSRCRLAVADFIYSHKLIDSLVAVMVDGVLLTDEVSDFTQYGYAGSWRFEGNSPALVLSKGEVWRPGKRPLGIGFEEITEAMRANPSQSVYVFGKRSVDLLLSPDEDRDYSGYPQTGGEALGNCYSSRPLELAPDAPELKSRG